MWELDPEWNIAKSSLAALPNLIPCVPSGKAIAPFDLMRSLSVPLVSTPSVSAAGMVIPASLVFDPWKNYITCP